MNQDVDLNDEELWDLETIDADAEAKVADRGDVEASKNPTELDDPAMKVEDFVYFYNVFVIFSFNLKTKIKQKWKRIWSL